MQGVKQAVATGDLGAVAARCNSQSKGKGPRAALADTQLRLLSSQDKAEWMEESRLDAILGSSARSMKSWRSGCRCYVSFVGAIMCTSRSAKSHLCCVQML